MIEGAVNVDGVPIIELSVAGRLWSAIVDTGFNGDLELPEALKAPLNARYRNQIESVLAGGQVVVEDNYTVYFPFDGRTVFAEATFVASQQILLGTHLLRDCRVTVDFVEKTVLVARVAVD